MAASLYVSRQACPDIRLLVARRAEAHFEGRWVQRLKHQTALQYVTQMRYWHNLPLWLLAAETPQISQSMIQEENVLL